MKSGRFFAVVTLVLLNVGLSTVAVGQNEPSAQEVVANVKEAASTLSKTGDLAQFSQKQSPWVWKNIYIFIQDCDKRVMAAHPVKPEMVGRGLDTVKDAKTGKVIYGDPADCCKKVEDSPYGVWNQYWWPKPGEKEPSRKLSYHLPAKGTPFVASAGIYDNQATIAQVSKLSRMK
jgi:cytochrome c